MSYSRGNTPTPRPPKKKFFKKKSDVFGFLWLTQGSLANESFIFFFVKNEFLNPENP